MVHFNELYVTEDGSKLIIDAEIDNLEAFEYCYIDSITVDIGDNFESGSSTGISSSAVTVWEQPYIAVGDFDQDGAITDNDYALFQDMYDDIYSAILNDEEISDDLLPYLDANSDGEVTVADLNLLTDILLAKTVQYTDVPTELTSRKRLCLDATDLAAEGLTVSDLGSQMFFVRVTASYYDPDSEHTAEIAAMDCGWDEENIYGVAFNLKPLYCAFVGIASSYGESCDSSIASSLEDFLMRYYGFMFAIECGDYEQAVNFWDNYLNNGTKSWIPSTTCGCHGSN